MPARHEIGNMRSRGELFGSWAILIIFLAIIAIILTWLLRFNVIHTNTLFLGIYTSIVSNLIWTVALLIIVAGITGGISFHQRRTTNAFFGLDNVSAKVTIFLSNIQIQKNGTIALESVSPGYFGAAVSRLEYQAAHSIRAIITKRPLNPVASSNADDWLGKIMYRVERTDVDIRISPVPTNLQPTPDEPLASVHLAEGASIQPSLKEGGEKTTGQPTEVKVVMETAQNEGQCSQTNIEEVASIMVNPGATKIVKEDRGANIVTDHGIIERQTSGFILGGARDAGVAVNHAPIVHKKSASQKPNCIISLIWCTSPRRIIGVFGNRFERARRQLTAMQLDQLCIPRYDCR